MTGLSDSFSIPSVSDLPDPIAGSRVISRPSVPELDRILGLRFPWLEGCPSCWISVVDYMGNDRTPARAARKSTRGKDAFDDLGEKRDRGTTRHLVRNFHTSPLENCEMRFDISLPYFVLSHMVRHRTANLNVFSGRFGEFGASFYVPAHLHPQSAANKQMSDESVYLREAEHEEFLERIESLSEESFSVYENAVRNLGVSRETARIILPQNIITTMSFKMDAHNLMHFLKLRLAPDAQYETRCLARMIETLFAIHVPDLYRNFVEYRRDAVSLPASDCRLLGKILESVEKGAENADKEFSREDVKRLKDCLSHS